MKFEITFSQKETRMIERAKTALDPTNGKNLCNVWKHRTVSKASDITTANDGEGLKISGTVKSGWLDDFLFDATTTLQMVIPMLATLKTIIKQFSNGGMFENVRKNWRSEAVDRMISDHIYNDELDWFGGYNRPDLDDKKSRSHATSMVWMRNDKLIMFKDLTAKDVIREMEAAEEYGSEIHMGRIIDGKLVIKVGDDIIASWFDKEGKPIC